MRNKKETRKTQPMSMANNAAIGAVIAFGMSIVLLFIAAWLLVSGRLSEGFMGTTAVLVLFISAFVGAAFAIRRNKEKAVPTGLLTGGLLYALTFVIGAFSERASLVGELSLHLLLACLIGGLCAGFLKLRPKKRRV